VFLKQSTHTHNMTQVSEPEILFPFAAAILLLSVRTQKVMTVRTDVQFPLVPSCCVHRAADYNGSNTTQRVTSTAYCLPQCDLCLHNYISTANFTLEGRRSHYPQGARIHPCTGHTQKNGAVNTQITTTTHHSFVYALYKRVTYRTFFEETCRI
jgi:hypothetical protein